jgi:SAM-dependent methyltransferase
MVSDGLLPDEDQAATFDLVLCHGVAMYQPDPPEFINQAVQFAKPGGTVSVLEKDYFGALSRVHKAGSRAEFDTLQKEQRALNHLGLEVYAFKPREMRELMEAAGTTVCKWAGVRLMTDTDYRFIRDVDRAELTNILDEEHELGNNPEKRPFGQMLHFIASLPPK